MLTYHDIAAAVAIRINALVGSDPVELQVTYTTRPLTDELFDSSIFPFGAVRDSILECEGKMAQAIALSSNRSLRGYLRGLSVGLASGAALPKVDAANVPAIGNFGAVLDGTDSTPCTPKTIPEVRGYLQSPLLYIVPMYHFAIDGATIIHTRTTVKMECCVYSAVTQTTAFDANGPILLPDSLAEAYINGAMALLVRDDEFTSQATQYANYFGTFLASVPPATMEGVAA